MATKPNSNSNDNQGDNRERERARERERKKEHANLWGRNKKRENKTQELWKFTSFYLEEKEGSGSVYSIIV